MKNLLSILWLIGLALVGFLSNKLSGCKYRLPISYLILAFTVYSLIVIQYWIPPSYISYILVNYWLLFIISIIALITLYFVPINSYLQILVFIIFILGLSILLHPLYSLSRGSGVVLPCLLTVISIFTLLSIISYTNPHLINLKWSSGLLLSLFALIILRLSFFWFTPSTKMIRFSSYIGIVIFSIYVLYDTKLMVWRAKNCNIKYNYLQNVVSLFLDFINLFADTMTLSNIK